MHCHYCGKLMDIDQSGVSHHLFDPKPPGRLDDIDYDADADHVAIPERSNP